MCPMTMAGFPLTEKGGVSLSAQPCWDRPKVGYFIFALLKSELACNVVCFAHSANFFRCVGPFFANVI